MNLFKISTLALALALTGWVACGGSSNSNPDTIPKINTGGAIGTGGTSGTGGAVGSGGAGGTTGTVADAGMPDAPGPGVLDTGGDAPIGDVARTDAPAPIGDVTPPGDGGNTPVDCTGLTQDQCDQAIHLAIINAPVDPSVSALDPGANPPVAYPACSAQ